jgi:hypothetical protein
MSFIQRFDLHENQMRQAIEGDSTSQGNPGLLLSRPERVLTLHSWGGASCTFHKP